MRTKGHNQSKFMRIITTPLKVLSKARDLYVNSLTNCATSGRYGHSMALSSGGQFSSFSSLPRSLSVASSRTNEDSEDYRELLRAASVRNFGHSNEIDMYMQQMRRSSMMGSKALPKSCSVGMGFMGRIDEDKACEFEEEDGDGLKPEVYSRSRSYAVARRSGAV